MPGPEAPGGNLLIGVDMGTASSKGVLTTSDGEIVATAVRPRPHSMQLPRPGWAEVDAETVWWADATSICRELVGRVEELRPGARVAGVCVSGAGPCLVLTDRDDRPVRPAILYGVDMRATHEIVELTQRYGAAEILDRCGKALTTQAVGPKISWVARHEPEAFARATRMFGSSSFVVRKLTGAYVLDHHTASQYDPMYDVSARDWHRPWADEIAAHLELPELAWPTAVVGEVTLEAAGLTGLAVGTPVCAGTIDAWSEAFSAGVRAPGDLMIMYGSTLFFVAVLDSLITHPQLWTTVGVDPDSYTMAAGMATSGSLTSWLRDLFGGTPFDDLVVEAAAVAPGSDGLVVLPYFAGERSPIFDPRARGVIAGLSLRHTRAHLYRAAYEGIAFGVKQILGLLDSDVAPVRRIVAVGGGTQGGLWTQIVSDVTGRAQTIPHQTIGASYGDALMAAIGVGLVPPDTDWATAAREVVPDPTTTEIYERLFDAYTDLYPASRPVVHALAELQEQAGAPPVVE